MTMTKRTQGRPPRDSGINGREKLIEATRLYLRSNRRLNLTRSEIALGCGVTPALISYYFKDKRSLIDAVIKPLISQYHMRLASIMVTADGIENRVRRVIRLLLEINTDNPFLTDYLMREAAAGSLEPDDRLIVEKFHAAIQALVSEMVTTGRWRPSDPFLTEIALLGLCKAFGEAARLQALDSFGPVIATPDAPIDYIFSAFQAADADCEASMLETPAIAD